MLHLTVAGTKALVNPALITHIREAGIGARIYFAGGETLVVEETLSAIAVMLSPAYQR